MEGIIQFPKYTKLLIPRKRNSFDRIQRLKSELRIQEIALMTSDPAIAQPKLSMENPLTSEADS